MKVLITGATGSLGGYLTRYFSKRNYEVYASGRVENPHSELLKCAHYIYADISKPCKFPDVDICIHAAAMSDDKASWSALVKPNVDGTKHVIEATRNCNKFIHISSSSVYLPSNKLIDEQVAGNQNNKELSLYGKSKLMAEEVVKTNCQNESCFILRPRALYGPGDKLILPRLLKLEKNGKLMMPGGLEVNISMTHYDNFARLIEQCIESKITGLNIYNVADESTYKLIDVVRKISEKLYGYKLEEKKIPIGLLKLMALFKIGGITKLLVRSFTQDMVLDISRAKNELNYNPQLDMNTSLEAIADWVTKIGGVDVIKEAKKELAWG